MSTYLDLEIWLTSGSLGGGWATTAAGAQGSDEEAKPDYPPIGAVIRLTDPAGADDEDPVVGTTALDAFYLQQPDPIAAGRAYSEGISRALFASEAVRQVYRRALARADAAEPKQVVRLRLRIHPSVLWLHRLHWEIIACPLSLDKPDIVWIAAHPRIIFSRTVATEGEWSFQLRAKERLRALVVVANPPRLAKREVLGDPAATRAIDVAGELKRARDALGRLIEAELHSDEQPVTFEAITTRLREGYDILYLVCHGNVIGDRQDQDTDLLLQDKDGGFSTIKGADLVEAIATLARRPLLVILAVCHSVGSCEPPAAGQPDSPARSRADGGALAGLGPRLIAGAGVGAVVAMQGSVLMTTVEAFMPAFFKALMEDGRVDKAMTTARSAILQAPDRWMPVLFTRLRTGAIWYQPGVEGVNDENWVRTIDQHLSGDICMPIIGPGLAQSILGSPQELARALARSLHVRLQPGVDRELPQAAQTIVARGDLPSFCTIYVTTQTDMLLRRCRDNLEPAQRDNAEAWSVIGDRSVERIARVRRLFELCDLPPQPLAAFLGVPAEQVPTALDKIFAEKMWDRIDWPKRFRLLDLLTFAVGFRLQRDDPHRVLARRALRLYLTSQPDSLFHGALAAEGIMPRVEAFRWSQSPRDWPPSIFADPLRYKYMPSPEMPLLYHLFGRLDYPETLVLTEDDYFEYLMGMGSIPSEVGANDWRLGLIPVREGLTERALLFLGFRVDDWAFRVILRSLLDSKRREDRAVRQVKRKLPLSIGVQLEPDEQILYPQDMRAFFTRFYQDAVVGVYWGEPGDFFRALASRPVREPDV